MTSTITCSSCQEPQSSDWSKAMEDKGIYTYCPACKILSWSYPPELSPFYQEGFRCEISTSADLELEPLNAMVAEVTKRLVSVGFRFEFDLADWIDDSATDLAQELKSLEGKIIGTAQLEMTSWEFNPEDEDSQYYLAPEVLNDPANLGQIVETAIADMFNNLGGDGYYAERHSISDALQGLTYDGNPVDVTVDSGDWTGNG